HPQPNLLLGGYGELPVECVEVIYVRPRYHLGRQETFIDVVARRRSLLCRQTPAGRGAAARRAGWKRRPCLPFSPLRRTRPTTFSNPGFAPSRPARTGGASAMRLSFSSGPRRDTYRSRKIRRIAAHILSGHRGHAAGDALLGKLLFEHLPDLRVFILVFDLVATAFHALVDTILFCSPGPRIFPAARAQREITCWIWAGVEMLVKPHLRRNDYAAVAPVETSRLRSFRPHERIALAADDDDVGTRPVPM